MAKKKSINEEKKKTSDNTFKAFKVIFLITDQKNEQSDKIVFKIDDGPFSGCIVNIQDFKFSDENSTIMLFNYNIVHIPDGITINDKKIQSFIKKTVGNILRHAVRNNFDESSNCVYVDA